MNASRVSEWQRQFRRGIRSSIARNAAAFGDSRILPECHPMNALVRLGICATVAVVPGCTCAASHTPDTSMLDVDAGEADGSPPDSGADVPDDTPDAECDPFPPYFAEGTCDADAEAACARWARQVWSGAGSVHVICEVTFAGGVICSNGDYCPEPSPSGPPTGCQCAPGVSCYSDEICVSDTPDGERRCVPRCS